MQMPMMTILMLMAAMVAMVRGHGMVIDPPQRSSMWRVGYPLSPVNYNDNQLYCGGFARQWRTNKGKCGVCGDPYDDPKPHANEAGGPFATGVIVRTYKQAEVIDVAVRITANHKGYFIFKLCPNNDVKKEATQDCLDKNVLRFVAPNGTVLGTKFYIDHKVDTKHVRLQLPSHITCSQCVLQWTYNTGNSWGCDSTSCCVGCGPQENFVNCVDIAITPTSSNTFTEKPQAVIDVKPQQTTASVLAKTTENAGSNGSEQQHCHANGAFAGNREMDDWCRVNCQRQYCPKYYCACS